MREFLKDKIFLKKLLVICLPIALQQLINTSMYMVDTLMIGKLGDAYLAGVGAANQVSYLLDICLFGVMSGAMVFMAQFYGKNDVKGIKHTLGLCLIFCLACAAIFILCSLFIPKTLVGLFCSEAPTLEHGLEYLSVAWLCFIPRAVICSYSSVHKTTSNARLPMLAGLMALIVNVFFNYCLIFGNLGFPMLGVKGAAIATLIGTVANMLVLIVASYAKKNPARATFSELFVGAFDNIKSFLAVSVPVFINDAIFAVGTVVLNFVYGQMGTEAFAAIMIVNAADNLAFVLLNGVGSASGIMIGNELGAGDKERASVYCKRFLWLTFSLGVLLLLLLCFLGVRVPYFYDSSMEVRQMAVTCIILLGLAQPVGAVNFTVIVGILRCGGDTRAATLIDTLPLWCFAIPAALIAGLIFSAPLPIVYALTLSSQIIRFIFGVKRVKSGSYLRTLV